MSKIFSLDSSAFNLLLPRRELIFATNAAFASVLVDSSFLPHLVKLFLGLLLFSL